MELESENVEREGSRTEAQIGPDHAPPEAAATSRARAGSHVACRCVLGSSQVARGLRPALQTGVIFQSALAAAGRVRV